MESLEEWRTKEKVQQSHSAPLHTAHCHVSCLLFARSNPSHHSSLCCVALSCVSATSSDLRDVDVLVRCIGGGLLQAAGVAALFSTGCWWGLSRVRGMTSFRKVVLTGGDTLSGQHSTAQHSNQLTSPAGYNPYHTDLPLPLTE